MSTPPGARIARVSPHRLHGARLARTMLRTFWHVLDNAVADVMKKRSAASA